MLKSFVMRLNPQSTIVSVFSAVMLSSLVCSLSVQQCHAGELIAESAEETEPLRTGQQAPSFVVRNADNEEIAFDPESLERPDGAPPTCRPVPATRDAGPGSVCSRRESLCIADPR